jgi:LysM repeat protein
MLYHIQPGDTLAGIAGRFRTTVEAILNANIICNPALVFPGQPIIVPEGTQSGLELPKSGGWPYYIVKPGDTLFCLSRQLNTSVSVLAANNQLNNPNQIYAGQELLVIPVMPNPKLLKDNWVNTAKWYCNLMSDTMEHGIYFIGTYEWEALGESALPFLMELLGNRCETVRLHAVMSLGRIGKNSSVRHVLEGLMNDTVPVAGLAELAIQRIDLVAQGNIRTHITFIDSLLLEEACLESQKTVLKKGTQVVVLEWHIPSPCGEEGPRGDIQVYDWVKVLTSGQTGFIPRTGFNDPVLI